MIEDDFTRAASWFGYPPQWPRFWRIVRAKKRWCVDEFETCDQAPEAP